MLDFITPSVAAKLKGFVELFRHEVSVPALDNWKFKSDAQLWAAVIGQIAVVGSAASGDSLARELEPDLEPWFTELREAAPASRLKAIHLRFRNAGVRYVTLDSASCKKAAAAAFNFELLGTYGGPKPYFRQLAAVPVESWRIGIVSDELAYIKNKGARDLLIGLGLAQSVIAFDTRLRTVLTKLGANLPPDLASNKIKYRMLEQELLAKVCGPCSISGGHLDRILFSRWRDVA